MIAPVRVIQELYDEEVVNLELKATFGFLWILVRILLIVEARDSGAGYVELAKQLLVEWDCCW